MTEISTYALAILFCVAVFGGVLGLLRILHERRGRSAVGTVEQLTGRGVTTPQRPDAATAEDSEEQLLARRPSLYGIPYLAWILTSLMILIVFLIIFSENLIQPYSLPEAGSQTWHSYRAPVAINVAGRNFERHQLIIAKGEVVSPRDRQVVKAALERRGKVSGYLVLGTSLLLAVFFFILLYHINILYPVVTEKNRNLVLIYCCVLIVLACAKLALFYDLFSAYLIPLPWAGMVIAILVNRRIVPLTMLITLVYIMVDTRFEVPLFLVLLTGGLVSGSWVRSARKRNQVMVASLLVGAMMALVYFCGRMLVGNSVHLLDPNAVASFSNGIISGLLALITLPILEIVFDFASPFRLMELLDLNTPILKEFFFKAPGTYQHSMVVANIAEAVANELGANGLLVRVGAYYHDIGKMLNPEYFIENQAGDRNPHDELGPVASAAVVRSHVILGLKLARQIGLPGPVEDFIPQHHGTSTIDYFYYKSKQLDSEMKSEKIFKYPGPKPQSRETAIVMLVDSVEASFRVVESRDSETVRRLVQRVADRKLEQGELDRSNLTIGELKRIIDILTHIMRSAAHRRVVYPSGGQPSNASESEKATRDSGQRRAGGVSG